MNNDFVLEWASLTDKVNKATEEVSIAMVGKYNVQGDSYLSIVSALRHSCLSVGVKLRLVLVDSFHLEKPQLLKDAALYDSAWEALRHADGVLVPGGFGVRGVEGKVLAAEYSRLQHVPYLGICLGMQIAVIEYARNILKRTKANSEEFVPDLSDVDRAVVFMPEGDRTVMGGTMRLGSRKTLLSPNTQAAELYNQQDAVWERHRHRYEVNPSLVQELEENGMIFSGKDEQNERMEVVELARETHPFFVASQFHPEFKSRPNRPAPLFLGFLQAIKSRRKLLK
jgi:CTP synthase